MFLLSEPKYFICVIHCCYFLVLPEGNNIKDAPLKKHSNLSRSSHVVSNRILSLANYGHG